jgi:hypothetical protein
MPDLTTTISNAAAGPKKASGDSGSVEQYGISELIEADRYVKGNTGVTKKWHGIRVAKLKPPGADT